MARKFTRLMVLVVLTIKAIAPRTPTHELSILHFSQVISEATNPVSHVLDWIFGREHRKYNDLLHHSSWLGQFLLQVEISVFLSSRHEENPIMVLPLRTLGNIPKFTFINTYPRRGPGVEESMNP